MKKSLMLAVLSLAFCLFGSSAYAQFNPYKSNTTMLSAGIGLSSWGLPVYGRLVVPVADNITVGGGLAYRHYGYSAAWNVSILSISGRGNYHFNELLDLDPEWDVYGGLDLTYYITNYNYDGPGTSTWNGGGPDGIGFSLHAGGRYFFKENLAVNAELDGGSISGLLLGITFIL